MVLIALCLVDVGEGRIEGGCIEAQLGTGFRQQLPGFLNRHLPATTRPRPVVGVRSDADDQLARVDGLELLVELGFEPALSRERTGHAVLEVLVVGHQDQPVRSQGQARIVVCGIGCGHLDQQPCAALLQPCRKLLHKRAVGTLRRGGKLLEIEHQSGIAAGGHVAVQLVDELGARALRREHLGSAGAVPALAFRVVVVDQGIELQIGRVGAHPPTNEDLIAGAMARQPAFGPAQVQPLGNHHVEKPGVALERGEAVLIPGNKMRVARGNLSRGRDRAAYMLAIDLGLVRAGRRRAGRSREQPLRSRELDGRQHRPGHAGENQARDQHAGQRQGSPVDRRHDIAATSVGVEKDWPQGRFW